MGIRRTRSRVVDGLRGGIGEICTPMATDEMTLGAGEYDVGLIRHNVSLFDALLAYVRPEIWLLNVLYLFLRKLERIREHKHK